MFNKIVLTLCSLVLTFVMAHAQTIYMTSSGQVSIFSETAVENIDGHSKSANMALNTGNGQVYASVTHRSIVFKKSLMQEHYNENYVESDKYPTAEFNGQIVEKIDYSKDGVFNVTLKGKFKVHGVEKEYTIPAKLTIKDGKITVNCSFDVKLDDHKIDRPTVVAKQLADTIKVTVDATLVPHK